MLLGRTDSISGTLRCSYSAGKVFIVTGWLFGLVVSAKQTGFIILKTAPAHLKYMHRIWWLIQLEIFYSVHISECKKGPRWNIPPFPFYHLYFPRSARINDSSLLMSCWVPAIINCNKLLWLQCWHEKRGNGWLKGKYDCRKLIVKTDSHVCAEILSGYNRASNKIVENRKTAVVSKTKYKNYYKKYIYKMG